MLTRSETVFAVRSSHDIHEGRLFVPDRYLGNSISVRGRSLVFLAAT